MKRREPNRKLNIWVARTIPLLLLAIIGYVSWTITKVLCIDYLLNPPNSISSRRQPGAAAAILVIYYVLLIMMLVCYGRLLDAVSRYPGRVPRGRRWYVEKQERTIRQHRKSGSKTTNKEKTIETESTKGLSGPIVREGTYSHSSTLHVHDFWRRDIFACQYDGRPSFCSTCYNWKPDRSHHCSELDRCVLKMDHFCPWVGGVVGETSFKFFIQFTFWAALFCLHTLVFIAYFFAQRKRLEGSLNVHMTVVLALAALFFLFSGGMFASSIQFAFINSTTIENLDRKRKIWYLAVHVPNHQLQQVTENNDKLRLITYPRPANEQLHLPEPSRDAVARDPSDSRALEDAVESAETLPAEQQRTFAILETAPGDNPWDIGYVENFKDLMGYRASDWFIPLRLSPCTSHKSGESFYKTGSVVQRLKADAGIIVTSTKSGDQSRSRRHRKRRRRDSSSHRPRSKGKITP